MTARDPRTAPENRARQEPGRPLPDDHGPKLWTFLLALVVIAVIIVLL